MESKKHKTKIMAVGDIHGDTGLVKKLAKKAKDEKVDLVILAGDLTWLEMSTENLIGPFVKENKEVIIIPGNHESNMTTKMLSEIYPKTNNLHGQGLKFNDIGIFGAGYSTNTGPFWIEESEMKKLLELGHEKIKNLKKKIMVTHMHPKDSKSEFSGAKGSLAIKEAIEKFKPDFVVSGHIHEGGGLYEIQGKTRIINVARNATIFEI